MNAKSEPTGVIATITVRATGEVWLIREIDDLRVYAGRKKNGDPDTEAVVLDPERREILLGSCYGHQDFGSAVLEAIERERTKSEVESVGEKLSAARRAMNGPGKRS